MMDGWKNGADCTGFARVVLLSIPLIAKDIYAAITWHKNP
ncbi:hypothetical protein HMPREF9080_01969 [Cardiobacterium valvarum F0432]|uniref:Uncharacterized protein n=1 Tax=Cardiobacterium valvarum F0432 TaxID=797473 RepID=G9ZGS4_9GAMM|nr:hypothetical protein HMPREF9080_01969 [Cardiobacterium valvarum F0432]